LKKKYIFKSRYPVGRFFFWFFAFILSTVLVGCYKPVEEAVIISSVPVGFDTLKTRYYVGGFSVENRPLEYWVLGEGRDVIFIMASIHGNEQAGTPLVKMLAEHLKQNPRLMDGRSVVLLPVANPDGVYRNNRYNVRGVDLNRNFAANNRSSNSESGYTALSEPEALVIARLIRRYQPDRIISIHQPLSCVDYDGPGEALASRMAEYCNLPVRKLGAQCGSLGSYAGVNLGIPIITLELPGPKGMTEIDGKTVWNNYGKALVAAIVYPERIAK